LLLEATRYYDRHGTANQQMRAHYLLGCAYRDMGEAPAALQSYQDAVDHADTLSTNFDYKQLCRVYAQMAQIFYEQGLYREQLVFQRQATKHAWKGKDTLAALMSYEQESQAYRNLNMPDSLLYICEHVSQLYRKYGYTRYATIALFGTFSTLIHRLEFDKVRKNMQIYESESELFDSLGQHSLRE
jgi:tetratricopeptide (TPR) repeat protein